MDYMLIYQELLSKIKNSKLNFSIKESLNDINNDKKLLESIKEYKVTNNESLRKEIYNNENFKRYKKLENETNMLILKLNNIFKESSDINENN